MIEGETWKKVAAILAILAYLAFAAWIISRHSRKVKIKWSEALLGICIGVAIFAFGIALIIGFMAPVLPAPAAPPRSFDFQIYYPDSTGISVDSAASAP